MNLGLSGRAALVTGGSDGIGKATAHRLAAEGASVGITARRTDHLRAAAREIAESTGKQVFALPGDVTEPDQIQSAVDEAAAAFGRLDILVSNAGRSAAGHVDAVRDGEWREDLDLKLMGAVLGARAAAVHMRRQGGGRIINITTPAGKAPRGGSVPTSVSRAAGIALTKAMSLDYAADRITVNTVCIGLIKSAQHERSWRDSGRQLTLDEWYERLGSDVPLRRVGEAAEAADLIAFLASERAAYITGTAVNIDGGMSPVV